MFVPDLMNRTNRPNYTRIPMRRQLSLRHQWLLFKKKPKSRAGRAAIHSRQESTNSMKLLIGRQFHTVYCRPPPPCTFQGCCPPRCEASYPSEDEIVV